MKTDLKTDPGNRKKNTSDGQKPGNRKISWLMPMFGVLFLLGGIGVFLYPTVSNYLAEKNQTRAIQTYQEAVDEMDTGQLEEAWRQAEEYNENLTGDPVHDPFMPGSGYALPENYLDVLNVDGVMGYVEIPKINVYLPIYHGTAEETLRRGVGHMESTTLPIGGTDRHAVLTGHRGLPSAKLFTDLNLLEPGDHFYVHVLGKILAYEVDSIKTVKPDELALLTVEPGRDLVTLITCTPYGVNTHRLLVRGTRVEYVPQEQEETGSTGVQWNELMYGVIGVLAGMLLLGIVLLFFLLWKKQKKEEGTGREQKRHRTRQRNKGEYR